MLNLIFPTWLFFGVFFIDSWNLMNSISFITYRYMLATIFISHLTILGLSYKSIQSYQRKWSRNETWVRLTTYFHEYSKSTYCFHQILCYKVRTFWETHKIWKSLPHGFDKSADLLSKPQTVTEIFSNYVCFSESLNLINGKTGASAIQWL